MAILIAGPVMSTSAIDLPGQPALLHGFKRLFNGFALLAVIGMSSSMLAGCGKPADVQGGPPPASSVSVAPAVQRTISDSEEFSGRLETTEFVELRARVTGTVDRVHFTDGAMVKKGQLLFTIDPRPFAAEVARAQSQVIAARARAELANTQAARAKKLLDTNAVSRQEFDQLNAGSRTGDADIKTAQAALQVARLNLDFASVKAPISGRISRATVTAGNVINEQVVLTSIAGVSRMYAYFDGSEQTFLRVQAARLSCAWGWPTRPIIPMKARSILSITA